MLYCLVLNETSMKKRFRMLRQKLSGTCRKLFQRSNHLFLSWLDLSPCWNICTQWSYKCLIRCQQTEGAKVLFSYKVFVLKCSFEVYCWGFLKDYLYNQKYRNGERNAGNVGNANEGSLRGFQVMLLY